MAVPLVVIAHRQTAGIRDVGEAVHPAAVDLSLFLIEAMHKIAGLIVRPHIFGKVEGTYRKVGWETWIGCRRIFGH